MYKFIYKNKKTGARILSHTEQDNENLVLVSGVRTTDIKRKEVVERKKRSYKRKTK